MWQGCFMKHSKLSFILNPLLIRAKFSLGGLSDSFSPLPASYTSKKAQNIHSILFTLFLNPVYFILSIKTINSAEDIFLS